MAGQVITVSGVTLSSSQTLTITYGAGGGSAGATPPATLGNATFTTSERSSSSGTLTVLAASPVVGVVAPPDGTGTMTVSPTSVLPPRLPPLPSPTRPPPTGSWADRWS